MAEKTDNPDEEWSKDNPLFVLERNLKNLFDVIKEPASGWQFSFRMLLCGFCPYCLSVISSVTSCRRYGLTWSCSQGCNP